MNILVKLSTIALITPSLLNLLLPQPVEARNQFDVCLKRLLDSGVEVEAAQTGCATALLPRDLSSCVANITRNTEISGLDALQNCYRVRRPIEMGDCVVNINKKSIAKYKQPTDESISATEVQEMEEMETMIEQNDNMSMLAEAESPLNMALVSCRQSLLPARHSECVISLSRTSSASPIEAMETCLKAENFPEDLFPAY